MSYKNSRGRVVPHKVPQATLTDEQVLEIRRRYRETPVRQKKLADEYGVTPGQIHRIVSREQWTHLPEET